jgi:AraC family transcriptional regulator of arabinose operon
MQKKDNFTGQKIHVLPERIVDSIKGNTFTRDLYITDIGYFPDAKFHFRQRESGCPENILILCVDGMGWVEVNGKRDNLKKYQYTILPANVPHRYAAAQENPWTIYWLHFNGTKADHFVYPLDYPRQIMESENARFNERIELFREIYYNLKDEYSTDTLEYCSVLLMHLLGSLKYLSQFRKVKELYRKDAISKAIFFMKENKHLRLTLKEIAASSGLSVSHLCLRFKQKTSYTPIDYLTFLRMQEACSLLSFTSLKIKEIAEQVGYDDAYYFTRLFKKVMGKSPSKYREHKESYPALLTH